MRALLAEPWFRRLLFAGWIAAALFGPSIIGGFKPW